MLKREQNDQDTDMPEKSDKTLTGPKPADWGRGMPKGEQKTDKLPTIEEIEESIMSVIKPVSEVEPFLPGMKPAGHDRRMPRGEKETNKLPQNQPIYITVIKPVPKVESISPEPKPRQMQENREKIVPAPIFLKSLPKESNFPQPKIQVKRNLPQVKPKAEETKSKLEIQQEIAQEVKL